MLFTVISMLIATVSLCSAGAALAVLIGLGFLVGFLVWFVGLRRRNPGVAAVALLVHAAAIDGDVTDAEREKLHAVIKQQFALDEATTDELVAEATEAEHEAIDLYHFTSLINRSLDEEGRRRIVEMMWEIAYADGDVDEFERNLIWRAADLLAVSSRDRIDLKHRVAERQQVGTAGSAKSADAAL